MTWRTKKRNLTSENSTARPGENLCLPNFQPRMDANKREYSQTSWGQTSWGRESFHSVIPEIPATVKQFLFNTIYHHAEKTPDPLVESLGWVRRVTYEELMKEYCKIRNCPAQAKTVSWSFVRHRIYPGRLQFQVDVSSGCSGKCQAGRNELCWFEIETLE